jgi:hypothetical protein
MSLHRESSDGYGGIYGRESAHLAQMEMAGWLYKASGGTRFRVKFDRRWFVLGSGVLTYYVDASLKEEKGTIALADVVEANALVRGNATRGTFPPSECRFELRTAHRDWVLAVDPRELEIGAKRKWLEVLARATGLRTARASELRPEKPLKGWLWMRKANKSLGWKERFVVLEGGVLRVFKTLQTACVAEVGPLRGCAVERCAPSGNRWTSERTLLRFQVFFFSSGVSLFLPFERCA